MKTDDLIGSLVADQDRPPTSSRRTFAFALPLALLVAYGVFRTFLEMRPDFGDALMTWRYDFKILVAASVAAFGTLLLFHMARPQTAPRTALKWILLALVPLGLGLLLEMVMLPMDQWPASAMGFNPVYCLTMVPLMAVGPLGAALLALRHGAPQSPTVAGAIAGFAAGGIGALLYAVHCDNDSPFYVAIWYLGAIGIVTAVGAVLGRLCLRW
nr:DUF1109 domain-containing protein [uncultured Dongia sp.]